MTSRYRRERLFGAFPNALLETSTAWAGGERSCAADPAFGRSGDGRARGSRGAKRSAGSEGAPCPQQQTRAHARARACTSSHTRARARIPSVLPHLLRDRAWSCHIVPRTGLRVTLPHQHLDCSPFARVRRDLARTLGPSMRRSPHATGVRGARWLTRVLRADGGAAVEVRNRIRIVSRTAGRSAATSA